MFKANDPERVFIDWAKTESLGIKFPEDRPWYQVDPPKDIVPTQVYECKCKSQFTARCYECEDKNSYVYLGQCARCLNIAWCIKFKKANEGLQINPEGS